VPSSKCTANGRHEYESAGGPTTIEKGPAAADFRTRIGMVLPVKNECGKQPRGFTQSMMQCVRRRRQR